MRIVGDVSEQTYFSEIELVLGEFGVTVRGKLTDLRRSHFTDAEVLKWFDEMHVYQIREGDREFFGTLEHGVLVNHMATVLLDESVDEYMNDAGYIDLENGKNVVEYVSE